MNFIFILLNILFLFISSIGFAQEADQSQIAPDRKEGATEEAQPANQVSGSERVIEIKPLGVKAKETLYAIELRDAELKDLFKVLAYDCKLNLVIDKDVAGKMTASFSNVTLDEALRTIAESQNLNIEKKGSIIKITPNLVTKIFTLKYIEGRKLLGASFAQSTAAEASDSTTATPSGSTANKAKNTIYDLLSEKGKILSGDQPNSIIVIDYPPNIKKVEDYIKAIDQRMNSRVFKLKYLKASEILGEKSSRSQSATSSTVSATGSGGTNRTTNTASLGGV
jgi:type II secretory pathway component HofQ